MKTLAILMLLLTAFATIPGSSVSAQQDNEFADLFEEINPSELEFTDQPQMSAQDIQLALINNDHNFVMITAGLFAFSLVIITILMKMTPHQAKDLVTIIGLVSVIFGSLLLVLVVNTTEALTAPMGILGAIAGYLFGSAQRGEDRLPNGQSTIRRGV